MQPVPTLPIHGNGSSTRTDDSCGGGEHHAKYAGDLIEDSECWCHPGNLIGEITVTVDAGGNYVGEITYDVRAHQKVAA